MQCCLRSLHQIEMQAFGGKRGLFGVEFFGIIVLFLVMLVVPSELIQWGAGSGYPIAIVIGAVLYVAYLAFILYRIDSNLRKPALSIFLMTLLRGLAVCSIVLMVGIAAVWSIWMRRPFLELFLRPEGFWNGAQQVIQFLSKAMQRSSG